MLSRWVASLLLAIVLASALLPAARAQSLLSDETREEIASFGAFVAETMRDYSKYRQQERLVEAIGGIRAGTSPTSPATVAADEGVRRLTPVPEGLSEDEISRRLKEIARDRKDFERVRSALELSLRSGPSSMTPWFQKKYELAKRQVAEFDEAQRSLEHQLEVARAEKRQVDDDAGTLRNRAPGPGTGRDFYDDVNVSARP